MDELQDHFVEALSQCIDNGMKWPFIVCVVRANGSATIDHPCARQVVEPGSSLRGLLQHNPPKSGRNRIN
jgi:hypothetical protein